MDIQVAKKVIEKGIKPEYERLRQYEGYKYTGGWLKAIEVLLNELDKNDKIIDLMATMIDNYDSQLEINIFKDKEHIKRFVKEIAEGN